MINDAQYQFVGGGYGNMVVKNSPLSAIVGGVGNCINNISKWSFIGGGSNNHIDNYGIYSSIIGGRNNYNNGFYNTHIIGSNINANASNTTFVNNLCVTGSLFKPAGYFRIPHPDPIKKKTHDLVHSFVESPTSGDNIYRFELDVIDGYGEIDLPEYYKFLNTNTQVWISPVDGFGIGYGNINDDETKIIVKANIDMKYNVLVIGTRKDDYVRKNWKGVERESNNPV